MRKLVILFLLIVGCGVEWPKYEVDYNERTLPSNYDMTWYAVVSTLMEGDFFSLHPDLQDDYIFGGPTISRTSRTDKQSGTIVTDLVPVNDLSYAKCLEPGSNVTILKTRVGCDIYVKIISTDSTKVRINCTFAEKRSIQGTSYTTWEECQSNGILERYLHEKINEKIKQ